MTRYWVGVASRDHVRKAVNGGFCMMNHGREAPLKRIANGDRVLYYSPREDMRTGAALKSFTAIGEVTDGAPYRVEQSEGFKPFRRDVSYFDAEDAGIAGLREQLAFSRGEKHWGLLVRRGLFEIDRQDYEIVAAAMNASRT